MDGEIRMLPDAVANQIAAGEVVQRPASVVKELLENAVDAGATDINLIVTDAGKTLIQVIDNGKGMGPADAKMCFERHATSKIHDTKDIFNIITKGFRGEALASIAAVAMVELSSRKADSEIGECLKIEGSTFKDSKAKSCPIGTSIAVKNLFFNVPARRKFLKSDNVENRHIIEEYFRVAMAHPSIKFGYTQNGKSLYNTPAGNQKQRIVQLYGKNMDEKLAPISEETNLFDLSGFIVKPAFARKTRGEQYIFVNNRFIKSQYLHHAINSAFEGLIDKDQHAGYFLFFEMDPGSIDINIHPTKTEIKFEDEKTIYQLLRSITKRSLGMYNLAPPMDFVNMTEMEFTPVNVRANPSASANNSNYTSPKSLSDRKDNSFDTPSQSLKSLHQESLVQLTKEEEAISKTIVPTEKPEWLNIEQEIEAPVEYNSLVVLNKYLLSATPSGLMLIDIKRAKQRLVFDQFAQNSRQISAQGALFDELLPVSTHEQEMLSPYLPTLKEMGIHLESFGKDSMVIRTVPTGFNISNISDLFDTFMSELKHSEDINPDSIRDIMAKRLALASSLHFTLKDKAEEKQAFLEQLMSSTNPSTSPFGKNILKQVDGTYLDKILQ
jgi:DNA mismatch repair protein MutL